MRGGVHDSSNLLNASLAALRVDVNLVLVPVNVTDIYQRPILGLQKSEFRVLEDGVEREVSQFYREETPISVGVVFDASTSMLRKMDESRRAVVEFMKMSMPGDEFSLLKFSDYPEIVSGFTSDPEAIEDGLQTIQPNGWTSLYDAIYMSMRSMKHAKHDRKVLLVLSDGRDNDSRYTQRELTELIKEADVRIFSISILNRSSALDALAEVSGGRAFRVRNLDDLPSLAADISAELHSQYVLGFLPPDQTRDGKYHKLKVELMQPAGSARLRVSWKPGYYGPTQ